MYGSDRATEELEQTAFRRAEKKYKLYYDYNARSSRKKKLPREVDLSDVLDFKSILESYDQNGELPDRVYAMKFDADCLAFCLEARPGFYFIPGALSIDEQCHWIKESLLNFPQPPNRTNHNVIYGPIPNLFNAAKEKKIMVSEMSDKSVDTGNETKVSDLEFSRWKFIEEDDVSSRDKSSKSVLASVLLRKLRWSTLGLQFDWSKRNYNAALQHQKIPDALGQLARRLTAPAMKSSGEFQPEAAIVNYFGAGDTLGGHLDDMEADWKLETITLSPDEVICQFFKNLVWAAKPYSFWEENPDKIPHWQCFCVAVMLYSWLRRQENASMVSLASSPMNKTPKSTISNHVFRMKMMRASWNTSRRLESTSTSDKSIESLFPAHDFSILNWQCQRAIFKKMATPLRKPMHM